MAWVLDVSYPAGGVALIIEVPTGFLWTNQTGGTACHHPRVEGLALTIDLNYERDYRELWNYAEAHCGWGFWTEHEGDVPTEIMDWLDRWLADRTKEEQWMPMNWGRVDRARAKELLEEAWLPLENVFLPDGDDWSGKKQLGPFKAILTWENSD